MDATCTIQDSIHVFSLIHKYVSRILGTYQTENGVLIIQTGIYGLSLGVLKWYTMNGRIEKEFAPECERSYVNSAITLWNETAGHT